MYEAQVSLAHVIHGPDEKIYELLRLPMGYKAGPEIMQLLTSSLAGMRGVVVVDYEALPTLGVDIWNGNIRIHSALNTK